MITLTMTPEKILKAIEYLHFSSNDDAIELKGELISALISYLYGKKGF